MPAKIAGDVAGAIISDSHLSKNLDVLDFGCGTGLVTLRIQPLVKSITSADGSQGMLAVLKSKVQQQGLTNVIITHLRSRARTHLRSISSDYDEYDASPCA